MANEPSAVDTNNRITGAPVVCIGDAIIDEVSTADGVHRYAGGAGLNLTVGLRLLHVPSSLITSLGADADGDWLRQVLAAQDVTLIGDKPTGTTGVAYSTRTGQGTPVYHFNDAMQQRSYALTAAVKRAITQAPIAVLNTFPFDDRNQTEVMIDAFSHANGLTIVDPNPRPELLHNILRFTANFERMASNCDLVVVSRDDADLLYGIGVVALGKRLLDLGARNVLITEGSGGATIMTAGGHHIHTPVTGLPGPIVDTMGAGTAVLATIVATLYRHGISLSEDEWRQALSQAMLVAAATCRNVGGILTLPS